MTDIKAEIREETIQDIQNYLEKFNKEMVQQENGNNEKVDQEGNLIILKLLFGKIAARLFQNPTVVTTRKVQRERKKKQQLLRTHFQIFNNFNKFSMFCLYP